MEHDFVLPFLGRRDYLHGTTLFDLLLKQIPLNASVSFKIASIIRSDRIRIRSGPVASGASKASSSLKWATANQQGLLEAYPLPLSPTVARIPYDEALVTRGARLDASVLYFDGPSPFSLIATLVPLFKEQLKGRKSVGSDGQWMFTRLDMESVPTESFLPLRLELDQKSSGAMARCTFEVGAKRAGQLYFSWVGSA